LKSNQVLIEKQSVVDYKANQVLIGGVY